MTATKTLDEFNLFFFLLQGIGRFQQKCGQKQPVTCTLDLYFESAVVMGRGDISKHHHPPLLEYISSMKTENLRLSFLQGVLYSMQLQNMCSSKLNFYDATSLISSLKLKNSSCNFKGAHPAFGINLEQNLLGSRWNKIIF